MAKGFSPRRVLAEGDEGAAQGFRRMLEGSPVVYDDGLASRARDPGDEFLHQDGFARTRLPRNGHVVVARLVRERRPGSGLTAPAHEKERGRGVGIRPLAAPLPVHRRYVHDG